MDHKKQTEEIEALANKLPASAAKGVLFCLLGAMYSETENKLLHHCTDFSKQQIESIKSKQN